MAESYQRIEKGIYRRGDRWYVRFEKDGKTVKEVTNATNLTEARKARAVCIGKVAEDKHVSRTNQRVTIGGLLDGLLESWKTRRVASLASASCQLEAVRREFGHLKVRDWTEGRAEDYVQGGATKAEQATRSGRMAILKAAMRRQMKAGKLDKVPSFPKRIKSVRTGFLHPEEFEDRVRQVQGVNAEVYRFLYTSGQRRERVLALRETDVDRMRWVVVAQDAVGNKERPEIRLRGEARRIIEARLRAVVAPGGLLFHDQGQPISGGAISQQWRRITTKLGRRRMLHDLRRSAYVNFLNAGVDTLVAERLIGHKNQSMASNYIPTAAIERAMDEAIDKRDDYVAQRLRSTGFAEPDQIPDHDAVPQEVGG